jgi:hypothetical protein
MKTKYYLLGISLLLLTSCATTQSSVTVKSLDIYGSGVIQHPVVAELDVKNVRVEGIANAQSGVNMDVLKSKAIADALSKSGADVLIEPVYESESRQGRIYMTVRGYPGSYTNFRPATLDDVPLLDMGILQKAQVAEPQSISEERPSTNPFVALLVVGAAVAAVLMAL